MGLDTAISGLSVWAALTWVVFTAFDLAVLGAAAVLAAAFALAVVAVLALVAVLGEVLLAKTAGLMTFKVMIFSEFSVGVVVHCHKPLESFA